MVFMKFAALAKAQELRTTILKLAEKAETIAKRIGESAKDPSLPPRQAQLRIFIRLMENCVHDL